LTDPDRIETLGESELIELRIRGSRFLARSHPTADRSELVATLNRERSEFPDASHHCYGARLIGEDRCDDDGEPKGTAGEPILKVLQGAEVVGATVVVIRYFGGTKLGTGGLVRAYSDAAREALSVAPTTVRWHQVELLISVTFEDFGAVEIALKQHAASLLSVERNFDPDPRISVCIKESKVAQFERALIDATAGRVQLLRVE